jgi:hypothetical protein
MQGRDLGSESPITAPIAAINPPRRGITPRFIRQNVDRFSRGRDRGAFSHFSEVYFLDGNQISFANSIIESRPQADLPLWISGKAPHPCPSPAGRGIRRAPRRARPYGVNPRRPETLSPTPRQENRAYRLYRLQGQRSVLAIYRGNMLQPPIPRRTLQASEGLRPSPDSKKKTPDGTMTAWRRAGEGREEAA